MERVLPVEEESRSNDGGALFSNNVSRSLFDDHLWLSVGIRHTPSKLTRVRRLALCLALLYLSMIANAMWYGVAGSGQAAFSIGPISFTVSDLYTSLMTSVTVLPPTLIITMMFTKSANKAPKGG